MLLMATGSSTKCSLLLVLILIVPVSHADPLVLNDVDWPPYMIANKRENFAGLAKDILRHCLSGSNYELTYVNLPIKRTHLYMQSGRLDISIYSYKPDREAFIDFGKVPIFTSEYGFAVNAKSDIEINSLDDLDPLMIGHMPGLSHTPELMEIIEEKRDYQRVAEGHNVEALFAQMLSPNPRFDIMPNTKATFYWKARELGLSDQIKVLDFVVAEKDYYVTVSKNSKNILEPLVFLEQIDNCLLLIRESGVYSKFAQQYGLLN